MTDAPGRPETPTSPRRRALESAYRGALAALPRVFPALWWRFALVNAACSAVWIATRRGAIDAPDGSSAAFFGFWSRHGHAVATDAAFWFGIGFAARRAVAAAGRPTAAMLLATALAGGVWSLVRRCVGAAAEPLYAAAAGTDFSTSAFVGLWIATGAVEATAMFAPAAAMAERAGPLRALRRSVETTAGLRLLGGATLAAVFWVRTQLDAALRASAAADGAASDGLRVWAGSAIVSASADAFLVACAGGAYAAAVAARGADDDAALRSVFG